PDIPCARKSTEWVLATKACRADDREHAPQRKRKAAWCSSAILGKPRSSLPKQNISSRQFHSQSPTKAHSLLDQSIRRNFLSGPCVRRQSHSAFPVAWCFAAVASFGAFFLPSARTYFFAASSPANSSSSRTARPSSSRKRISGLSIRR